MKQLSMKLSILFLFASSSIALHAQDAQTGHGAPEPPMAGIQWAKGQGPSKSARPTSSPNLLYHGGPVQHGVAVQSIFWGSSWTSGDAKIAAMDTFYKGVGGSSYSKTNTEYTDATGNVSPSVSFVSHVIDPTATNANGQRTSQILNEVCSQITNPVANGYYPVYVDKPRGGAQFCAWHSTGSCGGVSLTFAFFFNLDGDAGCDPQDTVTGNPEGVAALANVSGHELSEMLTDPRLNAWYDSGGSENADKCAWAFGSDYVTFTNRSIWKIQGNWSNNAFNSGTGYPNRSGQVGCLDGANYK
jgi:hypothetical protein